MFRNPELLRKRIEAKEEEKEQKWVVALSGNEEKVLEQGLEGYSEYKERVRYKMIPFVW